MLQPPSYDDPAAKELVKEAIDTDTWLTAQQQDGFDDMTTDNELYLGKKNDTREEWEKWRANIKDPSPTRNIDVLTTAEWKILTTADPYVQGDGVGDEDAGGANQIERLIEYTNKANSFPRFIELLVRAKNIQGIETVKVAWKKNSRFQKWVPTPRDQEEFDKAVAEAQAASQTLRPINTADFDKWRQEVKDAYKIKVPEPPVAGHREFIQYEGPWYSRPSFYNLCYDPLTEQTSDQGYFRERILVTDDYLQSQVDLGVFDGDAVEKSKGQPASESWERYVSRLSAQMQIPKQAISANPMHRKMNELWEVYQPFSEFPFQVILNQHCIVNLDCEMPFAHGQIPYVSVRNTPIPGYYRGVGDLKPVRSLFRELEMHKNLFYDGSLLAILGVWVQNADIGIPDVQKSIKPGMILTSRQADALKRMEIPMPNPNAWNTILAMMDAIDDAMGTYSGMRGGDATIGRVAATEFEGRAERAQQRIVNRAARTEEDLAPLTPMVLSLWHQFGSYESRLNIMGGDPLKGLSRDRVLQALGEDYKFKGATQSVNRAQAVQQYGQFMSMFGQILPPPSILTVAREVLSAMGTKAARRIIPDSAMEQAAAPAPPTGAPVGEEQPAGEGGPPTAPLAAPEAPPEGAPVPEEAVPA